MSKLAKAFVGAEIHNGQDLYSDHALAIGLDGSCAVIPVDSLPKECAIERLRGGMITPGFVDLQVNGGGGVMFNEDPSIETLRVIAQAHATTGTIALLPTLITDTPDHIKAAIEAVAQAISQNVPGIVGIHLEGPHLSIARKGAHDPKLIRQMEDEDLILLLRASEKIANIMVTVAPESTSVAQIKSMADAGIVVSLGHTNADFETCMAVFDAGAKCATHLFNAMSQFGSREPGLVGAVLSRDDIYAGLIADGVHVHPASIRIALDAKSKSDKIFLVTDSMATLGSEIDRFSINGRDVYRKDHKLTLADGTLAGADLEMPRALSVMINDVSDDIATAMRRTTSSPAALLRERGTLGTLGHISQGIIYLEEDFKEARTLEG